MVLNKIAVGVDGSPTATDAFLWAVGLARQTEAEMRAISVWQTPFVCTYPWTTPSVEEVTGHARAVVQETLEKAGVTGHVESVIIQGAPGPALTAEASRADLLVVGVTGRGLVDYRAEFGEVMVGATARYCVNHAATPVLAIREGSIWVDEPEVVVGIDGSPTSLAALTWATQNLPAGAQLHAVHAITVPCDDGSTPIDYELFDPLVEAHRTELRRIVDAATDPGFTAAERTVQTHVVLGTAPDALVKPGFPCDLIVVGEHGETAAARHVLGSVSDHTLRHAEVPLLVVPSPVPGADPS